MKKVGIWMYENDNGINVKNKLIPLLKKKGYQVYDKFDMRECFVKDGKIYSKEGFCISNLDILYHMNADEQNEYQNDILKMIELSGVHVFNNFRAFENCKDKAITNLLLRKNGVQVPDSYFINNNISYQFAKEIFKENPEGIIVKPRRNHGGKGVIKFTDLETFWDFYVATQKSFSNYYIEEYIEFKEHDYRVEIFDNEVIGSYCRGKNGSYKTNISSGGKMLAIPVDDEFENIALKAAKILNITTTIVDMIRSEKDRKIYVLEVNPIMGIFLEEGMRAGTKMDVQKDIPEQFKTDDLKIEKIINYIDDYFNK